MTSRPRKPKVRAQSPEDADLAVETITAAFDDDVERARAALEKASDELKKRTLELFDACGRRAAWIEQREITEQTALNAHLFAFQDMQTLAGQISSREDLDRLDSATVAAARRKNEVTERWLNDRGLLPAVISNRAKDR